MWPVEVLSSAPLSMVSVPASVTRAGIGDRAESPARLGDRRRGQRQLGGGGAAIDGDDAGIVDVIAGELQLGAGFDFEVAGIGEDVDACVLVLDLVVRPVT